MIRGAGKLGTWDIHRAFHQNCSTERAKGCQSWAAWLNLMWVRWYSQKRPTFFSRFEPFHIPEEIGIDVAFLKARIWKTCQKLIRLIELLWLWAPLFSSVIYEDSVAKFWGKRNCSAEQDVLLAWWENLLFFQEQMDKTRLQLVQNISRENLIPQKDASDCVLSQWRFPHVAILLWTCIWYLCSFTSTTNLEYRSCLQLLLHWTVWTTQLYWFWQTYLEPCKD